MSKDLNALNDPLEDTVDLDPQPTFADVFFAGPQETISLRFGAATHPGKVREQNEDHFAVLHFRRAVDRLLASISSEDLPAHRAHSYAMVVADGMGGMKAGELASRRALQTMLELAGQATSWVMKLTDVQAQKIDERVEAYVQRIHAALEREGAEDPDKENMATTWTSAHVLGTTGIVVHLGDSRAYHFRDGVLRQITRDETMAQSLVESGADPETVKRFRHIVLNSFGGGNEAPHASIYELELEPEDRLLLCTDGLTGMVSEQQIRDTLQNRPTPQAACDDLVRHALQAGGHDNVTVVLAAAGAEADS